MDFREINWICIQGSLGCNQNTIYVFVSACYIDLPCNWRVDLYSASAAADHRDCCFGLHIKVIQHNSRDSVWGIPAVAVFTTAQMGDIQ